MIDYEKLGRLYGEGLESYLNGLVKHWEDKVQETKELIAKHKLTKPEPKYKVGQKWWALGNKGMPFEVEIVGIMGGDVDLLYPDGSCSYGGVKDLFPTRQSLIKHQIEYWSKLLQKDCKHFYKYYQEGDGTYDCDDCGLVGIKDDIQSNQPKVNVDKCLHKSDGINYNNKTNEKDCESSLSMVHLKCAKCGERYGYAKCQHESNGVFYNLLKEPCINCVPYPFLVKCIKCGEFYR